MKTVLLVDSNHEEAERCQTLLDGYSLALCRNGEEAVELICKKDSSIDVAIVLWELEGPLNGAEVLVRSKQSRPDLPIIVSSGLLDLSRAAHANALGASDFLLKPIEQQRLRLAVAKALGTPEQNCLLDQIQRLVPGRSRSFLGVLEAVARVVPQKGMNVLLVGETGTGKELLAGAIHKTGVDSSKPFVAMNMAETPGNLLESALFGHERGAFTDARETRIGAFEEAGDGTIFLDEIGDLELKMQAKLLRVLQERTFRRLGGRKDMPLKARLITATDCDLNEAITKGKFSKPLYYRISGYPVRIPPLRERAGDVPFLITHFLKKHGGDAGIALARETRELLVQYDFPGNVRELENIIKYALVEAERSTILPQHLPLHLMRERQQKEDPADEVDEFRFPWALLDLQHKPAARKVEQAFNRVYFPRLLRTAQGNVSKASLLAGLDPKTLRNKCEQIGLAKSSLFQEEQ